MTTAFVLSGGGSLGAVQVGMLQALAERGIAPDLLVGTSVGALNAAFVAGHGSDRESLTALEGIWSGLHRHDVFPLRPLRLGAAALGRAPSLCDDGALRRLVAAHLPIDRLEQARIPLRVVATDVRSGTEVVLSEGSAVEAVMASAAIPAVFPAVRIGDRDLIDGGIADNAAVSQAIDAGATRTYVLPTGYACALDAAPTNALASALHALTVLIEQRLILEVAQYAGQADIRVLPPLCPLDVSSTDFRHGPELIARARHAARRWLDHHDAAAPHPERVLALHRHAPALHDPPTTGDLAS